MQHSYSYQSALAASERIGWKVDDIIGGDKQLDFTKPFMPESLAQVKQLLFLTAEEQLTLNQIRGHEYLAMFGLVEEFILPYVVDHARPQLPETTTTSGLFSSSPARGEAHSSVQALPARIRGGIRQQVRLHRSRRRTSSRFVLSHSPWVSGLRFSISNGSP